MDYKERISISLNGDQKTEFYDKLGSLIAIGYSRIVIGDRGPYVEFNESNIKTTMRIPDNEQWRLRKQSFCYYAEFRTILTNIKIYYQFRPVDYADYKPGFYYISPFDLYNKENKVLIEKVKRGKDK